MKSMLRAVTRDSSPRVWTVQRKLLGNVLPLLSGAPFGAAAILLWVRGFQWDAIGLAAGALSVAAVSLNWLGLAGNATMRRLLAARLSPSSDAIFVGFSRPGYFDILDPHEDLGFLQMGAESLRIAGERSTIEIGRSRDLGLGYEFNPHALLGLGRWLEIQGKATAGPICILIEPRELRTLRSNRALSATLKSQLEAWRLG